MEIDTPSEREIAMRRAFDAPRERVFRALTEPASVRRWLLGPPGWTMPVCDIDLRVGGAYRYVWRHEENGTEMGMGGVYREIAAPERLVATELFDEPWYPGEGRATFVLAERHGRTVLTHTMRYESKVARDGVLASGIEEGVAASFDRLAGLLEEPER